MKRSQTVNINKPTIETSKSKVLKDKVPLSNPKLNENGSLTCCICLEYGSVSVWEDFHPYRRTGQTLSKLMHNYAFAPCALRDIWTATSEFGTYRLCEQRRFRRACACAQSRQNLRCSLIQAVSQEEPSVRKPDPWPL